ncbi:MAG: OmpH family outer membrane protein [Flavobacteriales bacterium]|nr:OmpH family outer membrane protein [Flavobacteriales bacterium]
MQKINTALIIIALLISGYLLVDRMKGSTAEDPTQEVSVEPIEEGETLPGEGKIAYINIDSININFTYLDDKLKVLKEETSRSERRMANRMRKAEEEYMKLQEEARYMTPSQMQEAEQKIQQSQMDLQAYQEKLTSDLIKLETEIQEDLNERIMGVVEDINAKYGYDYILAKSAGGGILIGNESYEITQEVIEMLNQRYAEELAAEKSEGTE